MKKTNNISLATGLIFSLKVISTEPTVWATTRGGQAFYDRPVTPPYTACQKVEKHAKNGEHFHQDSRVYPPPGSPAACVRDEWTVPGTNFIVFNFGNDLRDWTAASNLAELVGERKNLYTTNNQKIMLAMKDCYNKLDSWNSPVPDNCKNIVEYATKTLLPANKGIRLLTTLVYPEDRSTFANRPLLMSDLVGTKVKLPYFKNQFMTEKDPLTEKEKQISTTRVETMIRKIALPAFQAKEEANLAKMPDGPVKKQLKQELDSFLAATKKESIDQWLPSATPHGWTDFVKKEVRESQHNDEVLLISMIADTRLSAFISKTDPTPKDLAHAIDGMLLHNQALSDRTWTARLNVRNQIKPAMSDYYELTSDPWIMEEVLTEHPEYCAIASALFWHSKNNDSRINVLPFAASTAVSVAAVPLGLGIWPGLMGALAVDGLWISDTQRKFQEARLASTSAPFGRSFDVVGITSKQDIVQKGTVINVNHTLKEFGHRDIATGATVQSYISNAEAEKIKKLDEDKLRLAYDTVAPREKEGLASTTDLLNHSGAPQSTKDIVTTGATDQATLEVLPMTFTFRPMLSWLKVTKLLQAILPAVTNN